MAFWPALDEKLSKNDPAVYEIITNEQERQDKWITLIASENFTSTAVNEAVGSVLTNKYAEGFAGKRYYGGTENYDRMEFLCEKRALAAFHLDPKEWGVTVQAFSGTPANLATYLAFMEIGDTLMYLDLSHGGHLSHGHHVGNKKISCVSRIFNCVQYHVNLETGIIDYDELARLAQEHKPKIIVCGTSSYSRLIDYKRFKEVAVSCGAKLHCDIAHIGVIESPFLYADTVMTTTHKSVRGPRGALIFYLKPLEEKIRFSLFPGLQGGPHNHTIAGIAVALEQCSKPEFRQYQLNVLENAKAMANVFNKRGIKILTGGTETHLIVIDLIDKGLNGFLLQAVCDACYIAGNKNALPADTNFFHPNGFRVGTPAMTSRGVDAKGFEKIAEFIVRAIEIAQKIRKENPSVDEFVKALNSNPPEEIKKLKEDVLSFTSSLQTYGFKL